MIIREFTVTDQLGVIRLQDEFMQEFFAEFINDPRQCQWNADVRDLDKYYLQNGGKFWVAEEDQEIVGVGGFRLVSSTIAEIKRLRIKASCRGKGLGKAIVQIIENYCRDKHIVRILVDTDGRLVTAKTMYERLGYTAYRVETVAEDKATYTNYYFEKDLSQP